MSIGENGRRKDVWDRFAVISGFLAAVLVPLALGLAGHWYADAIRQREVTIKEREAALKEQEFARQWVEISLDILRDPGAADQESLRRWAVRVVNHYTEREIHMEEELQEDLATGRARLPAPRPEGGRVERLEALQTVALEALLQRDIDGAIEHMETAHREWHDFRTVWETLQLLRDRRPELARGGDDGAWRTLYRDITRMMDMRGIPEEVRLRLRTAAE